MLEIHEGALDVEEITNRWYGEFKDKNFGAMINFIGVVREEGGIEGLSFDIYEPILKSWFEAWQERASKRGAFLLMAHSRGDVLVHTSSYISSVMSPKRRVSLELIDEFVEDFKASAPIWKYDIINAQRVYAKDRSMPLKNSGILRG
jgi:molybdopterin synthase catalytic subunit